MPCQPRRAEPHPAERRTASPCTIRPDGSLPCPAMPIRAWLYRAMPGHGGPYVATPFRCASAQRDDARASRAPSLHSEPCAAGACPTLPSRALACLCLHRHARPEPPIRSGGKARERVADQPSEKSQAMPALATPRQAELRHASPHQATLPNFRPTEQATDMPWTAPPFGAMRCHPRPCPALQIPARQCRAQGSQALPGNAAEFPLGGAVHGRAVGHSSERSPARPSKAAPSKAWRYRAMPRRTEVGVSEPPESIRRDDARTSRTPPLHMEPCRAQAGLTTPCPAMPNPGSPEHAGPSGQCSEQKSAALPLRLGALPCPASPGRAKPGVTPPSLTPPGPTEQAEQRRETAAPPSRLGVPALPGLSKPCRAQPSAAAPSPGMPWPAKEVFTAARPPRGSARAGRRAGRRGGSRRGRPAIRRSPRSPARPRSSAAPGPARPHTPTSTPRTSDVSA